MSWAELARQSLNEALSPSDGSAPPSPVREEGDPWAGLAGAAIGDGSSGGAASVGSPSQDDESFFGEGDGIEAPAEEYDPWAALAAQAGELAVVPVAAAGAAAPDDDGIEVAGVAARPKPPKPSLLSLLQPLLRLFKRKPAVDDAREHHAGEAHVEDDAADEGGDLAQPVHAGEVRVNLARFAKS